MELRQATGSRAASWRRLTILKCALLLCILVSVASWVPLVQGAEEARILSRAGDLFAKPEKGEHRPVPADRTHVPAAEQIESGAPIDPAARADAVKKPPRDSTVLSYSPREVVTLVSGSSVHRIAKDATKPAYSLVGPVHLLIHGPKVEGKEAKPLQISINGVILDVTEAHLFFDGWASPAQIAIVSGTAVLPAPTTKPADAASDAKTDAAAPAAQPGPQALNAGQMLILDPAGARVASSGAGEQSAEMAARQKWSTQVGFETPGSFKPAGYAVPSDQKLTFKRNGVDSKLDGAQIPIMEGDELLVPAGQKVDLQLDSKDKIALTGEAKFKLETFAARNVLPAFVFNVFGKMRALIAPKDPGAVQVKTVTAIIGVKGTDFETLASAGNTDVSVLEGKVGVTDPSGAGEVDVPAGHTTSVALGAKPLPPKPLPPDRLKELQASAPGPTAINITGPTEGALLSGGKIEFSVDPPSASIEVLLDDKPLPDFKSGGTLPTLTDGAHKVTVRGTAPGALSKTVGFTVDRKPPALDAAVTLATLTIIEGQPPVLLKWNKPLASAEVTYDGKTSALALGSDSQSAPLALDPAALKDVATAIHIKATDKAGNVTTSEGMLTFKRKPGKPPVLTATVPGPEWITNAPADLKVSVDREVEKWEVTLDKRNVTETIVKPLDGGKAPKEVTLSAALLTSAGDGTHPISIKATDSFGLVGEYSLVFALDRAAPVLTAKNAKDNALVNLADSAPLKPGRYDFSSAKPLKEVTVRLDGQQMPVALDPTGSRFALDAQELKPGEHSYNLHIADRAGNSKELEVKVVVAAPPPPPPPPAPVVAAPVAVAAAGLSDAEASLRNAYEHSAAMDSGSLKDQMYVDERGQFVLINIKAGAAGAQLSGKAVYAQDNPASVAKDLPEAFMREVTGH